MTRIIWKDIKDKVRILIRTQESHELMLGSIVYSSVYQQYPLRDSQF